MVRDVEVSSPPSGFLTRAVIVVLVASKFPLERIALTELRVEAAGVNV